MNSFFTLTAEKANFFLWFRNTSDEPEVQEEAQCSPDGLTIKHVHFETGTPAFYIQHCLGTDTLSLCGIAKNCLPSNWRFKMLRGPNRRMNALLAPIDNGKALQKGPVSCSPI
ncbi:MAG: hypothetical protein A3K03_10960 [Bdellovibrionales bacterium RIFOXYD1_FULL_44_7]|nr:MAG: hypothetical protein A3K03_10960 [Bdellovibrionales bacterium RIFOXYD1_FULL_44_7]